MRLRLKRKPSDDDIAGPSKRYKEEQSEDEGYNEDDVDVVGSDDEVDNLSDEEDANAVDDEDDEDDASVADDKPYDEATEAFPARAAFDKDLQALEEKTVASARMLRKTLDEHSAVSETLQNMKSKLDDAVQPPNPEREMVALVGGTGAGKSTFFNALTDTPQLAKALSAGESCTSVPTFYSHKLDWQNQPYAAEICYYTVEKCRKLLEDLLRQYNLYNFEPESDWTSDQRSEYSQQAETAFQTFRTLFCDQDLFGSQGDAEGSLEDHYKDSNTHELLDLMESWCEGFFADFDTEDDAGYTHHEADTVDELRSYTDPLTAPNHSFDEPSLWPLVELVRIGVSSSRVLKYVTIVDLPGITDTNKLRIDATHESIQKCQALWYFAGVDRICTDPDLERTIGDYAERFTGTFTIVVTKIDEGISDELANELRSKGQSIGDFRDFKANITRLKRASRAAKCKLRSKKLSASAKFRLREQEDLLLQELRDEESKRFECLVDARNDHIGRRLQKDKKKHLPAGEKLPIFFVSSKQYQVHKQVTESEGPRLGIESTGIPRLRSYTLGLAAKGVWKAHEEHLLFKIKAPFDGVNMWAEGPTGDGQEDQEGLMACIQDVFGLWDAGKSATIEKMQSTFDTGIIQRLRAAHEDSLGGVMRWYKTITAKPWWHGSFLAFFRKDGNHRTGLMGTASWNKEFIKGQTEVLDRVWKTQAPPEDFFDAAISKLKHAIEDIPEQLGRMPGSVALPISGFEQILRTQIRGIQAARDKNKAQYEQEVRNIKLAATLGQNTSYFSVAMQPCYDAGKADLGEGVCGRMRDSLHRYLTDSDPLKKANDSLAEAYDKNLTLHADALDGDVRRRLADISQQFNMILHRGAETVEEEQARSQIKVFLDGAMSDINRIEQDLANIRQKYPEEEETADVKGRGE